MPMPVAGMSAQRIRRFAVVSMSALMIYLALVLAGLSIAGLELRTRYVMLTVVIIGVVVHRLARRMARSDAGLRGLRNLGALSLSLLISLLIADMAYAIWRGSQRPDTAAVDVGYERSSDQVVWHGELYPRTFYPTKQNFVLYKPDVALAGFTYGEYYERRMLASPLLRDSVLEYRRVDYRINQHGLREDAALAAARIVALGDSYVFGYATEHASTWVEVLEGLTGQEIYNLGISATGPRQHAQLLEYMMRVNADSMRVAHVLWMIFEGNDLENSYQSMRDPPAVMDRGLTTDVAALIDTLRDRTALHALLGGGLRLARAASGTTTVNGIQLRNPLYHSAHWGYRLFNPSDIRSATRDVNYVRRHPNARRLAVAMRDVQQLAEQRHFRVTIILAPSDVRLYGNAFDGMPPISTEPIFLNYVRELADSLGFGVIDLATLMQPYAERELLYYRDDHHWNARGNSVAAALIAGHLEERGLARR